MSWIGKILGAFFGFLLLGPFGALLGFFFGHMFDKGLKKQWNQLNTRANPLIQKTFFDTSFSVMGYVAKADGRVSEKELQLARVVMDRMGLVGDAKIQAMRLFSQGKEPDFDLNVHLDMLKQICNYQHLLKMFLELQVQIAYADGAPGTPVRNLLQQISQRLGLGAINFAHIEAMLYGRWRQQQGGQYQQNHARRPQTTINEAYQILGINSTATPADIKRAYRRKMSENHPDKMIAKGLPKEMIELATAKTQQIQAAYEQIKQAKNFS
jgi:DnaJ like chaperone protein